MALFYNCFPQFEDINGQPYASGRLYFGVPNTDPKTNPKTIYLNDENTAPAANPQPLNSSGIPSQGQLYLVDGELYSVTLEDVDGNQIATAPAISGVDLPNSVGDVPPVVVQESVTVTSDTTAQLIIDSGVVPNAVGEVVFQEAGVTQFVMRRKSIVDGGELVITNVSAGGNDELEFPLAGGVVARFDGAEKFRTLSGGVNIDGRIDSTPQVPVAFGTFTAAGAPIGKGLGILSAGPAAGSPTGEYEIVLETAPNDETDLQVLVQAELAGAEMNSRGVGGPFLSGTALIFTSDGATNARANCTNFTVVVWDAGRT